MKKMFIITTYSLIIMSTMSKFFFYISTKMSKQKTKKCQPAAVDRPDLIKTVPVNSSGLARHTKKSTERKKYKFEKLNYCKLPFVYTSTKMSKQKTKKCQPAAVDRPDLIKTVPVKSSRLAHHTKKSTECKKYKFEKLNYCKLLILICLMYHELIPTGWKPSTNSESYRRQGNDFEQSWRKTWEAKELVRQNSQDNPKCFQSAGWDPGSPQVNPYRTNDDLAAVFLPGLKLQNRLQRAYNGNIQMQLKVTHWNGGSRLWENKIEELELLLADSKPDICFVSESNLWKGLESHQVELTGHTLIYPKSFQYLNHARLMCIVREDLDI